jgi:ribosomal-protein-alanine N-acetyltransferase
MVLAGIMLKTPYQVTPIEKEHLAELVFLERQCFTQTWTFKQYQEILDQDNYKVLGIFSDNRLNAYIVFCLTQDEAEIINLAVHPEFRNMGLARSLISKTIDICAQAKVKKIFLEVRPSNLPALSVYRGSGFVEVARRKKYYQGDHEDALVLSLNLIPWDNFPKQV